jgi:hypothetical protein
MPEVLSAVCVPAPFEPVRAEPTLTVPDETTPGSYHITWRNANPPLRYPVAGLQHWLDLNA